MTMSVDFPAENLREPVISGDTALACLVQLGLCRRDDPEIEDFRHRAALEGSTLPASRLIELVGKFGVEAECARLDPHALAKGEITYPILVFLKNANAVLVTDIDSAAAGAVSVWDPLHTDGKIFSVPHEDFERAWSGDALVIARQLSAKSEPLRNSVGRRDIEAADLPPDQRGEQTPIAEAQLRAGSARRTRSGRLAAIALVAAVGASVPLWINGVADNVLITQRQLKEEISEAPQAALPTAELSAPRPVPSVEAPVATEPTAGSAAAAASPMPEPDPDLARPTPAGPPYQPAFATAFPPAATAPAAATPDANMTASPPAADPPAAEPRASSEEAAALLARGDALFSAGDLAAARLFYERAADAGEAQAAVRLGETFDPLFLDHAHLRGVPGNTETALSWYRRARDLGAAEAEVLLNSLQAK